jgi:superfamily II DNA helicase RecQ
MKGKGKKCSKEWWAALGRQLVREGYIAENIYDLYVTYSVSAKGFNWASTALSIYLSNYYVWTETF